MFNPCDIRFGKRENFIQNIRINFKCFDKLVGFKSLITIVRHDWGFHVTTLHRTLNCIKIRLNDGSLKTQKYWCWKRGENGKWILMVGPCGWKNGFKRLISHLKGIRTLYNSISFNCIHFISCYWIWSTWMKILDDFYLFHSNTCTMYNVNVWTRLQGSIISFSFVYFLSMFRIHFFHFKYFCILYKKGSIFFLKAAGVCHAVYGVWYMNFKAKCNCLAHRSIIECCLNLSIGFIIQHTQCR